MFTEQGYHRVDTFDDLKKAIQLAERAGAIGQAHLMRGLHQGRIAYLPLLPDTSTTTLKTFIRSTCRRPAVLAIGDDDHLERGPGGWPLAARAIAWARAIMVHGAAAELDHYEAVLLSAERVGRCLIIECSTTTLPAWIARVSSAKNRPPTLVIEPREGPHPLPVAREALQ